MARSQERELLEKLDAMARGAISTLGFPERQMADAVRGAVAQLVGGLIDRVEQLEACHDREHTIQ